MRYGFDAGNNHRGGRAIFQVEGYENLICRWCVCENCEDKERLLLENFKRKYGTYPIANGQVYGGDMPLEEAGNMLTLAAEISRIEGNTAYADRYWDIITTWADYLVEHGLDPANQLCTDDFAGHWAHNANLALKAIMGVAGYAKMAVIRGNADVAKRYMAKAREMGKQWEQMAREGDHYRLAYDREGTWSQKYNIVWDKMWGTHIFSDKVMDCEFKYYLTKQNKYGLPLDCRKDYTKSDWIMWLAGMAPNAKTASSA